MLAGEVQREVGSANLVVGVSLWGLGEVHQQADLSELQTPDEKELRHLPCGRTSRP